VENGEHLKFNGIKNGPYYCDVILGFREYVDSEKFLEIVGVKFSGYLSAEERMKE
jgi:hypothetical protein